MRIETAILAPVLAVALLCAGCKQHQPAPPQNQVPEAAEPVAAPPPEPTPAPTPEPVAPKPPKPKPAPPTPAEQQVIDDADATGMTARVDRAGNDSDAPAADTNREP